MVEFSTWLQDVYTNRNYDISLVDHNESHDFYQWADPTTTTTTTTRRSRPCTPSVAATNDDDRDKLLAEAARKVSEDAPADWLFNYRVTTAYAKGVTGFPINLNQTLLPLYNVAYTK